MKRTEDDQQFGEEFAKRLKPFYERALAQGQTEKDFARKLGVDRGGLRKYLKSGAMPSFRTIVRAYREFEIAIPYAGIEPATLLSGTSKRQRKRISELQMNLPLTIEAPEGTISVVIKRKTPHRVRLQLRALKLG